MLKLLSYQTRLAIISYLLKVTSGIFDNNIFVCNNSIKCADYSKVCDLKVDYGDKSDEMHCVQITCSVNV